MSAASTPPKRSRRRDRMGSISPAAAFMEDAPGTPEPTRARIRNLEGQVQQLVRKNHALERRITEESRALQDKVEDRDRELATIKFGSGREVRRVAKLEKELQYYRTESEELREELELRATVHAHAAAIAAADEELRMMELQQRLAKAEAQSVVHQHQMGLYQSRAEDLAASAKTKSARIADLEAALETANTSLSHQRAAEDKAKALASSTNGETRAEIVSLEAKVTKLEEKNAKLEEHTNTLKEKEREARAELEQLQNDDQTKGGFSDAERAELRAQLRSAKAEAKKRAEEATDATEELETYKESAKERLQTLKTKYRAAEEERIRLAGVEEELEALKSAGAKAAKPKKTSARATASPELVKVKKSVLSMPKKAAKVRKASPADSDSDVDIIKKKPKKAEEAPAAKVLGESDRNRAKSAVVDSDSDSTSKSAMPKATGIKKKRKLLGGAAPAFNWDHVMDSGDGVIPTTLSPIKTGARTIGNIPRAGFGNLKRF